MVTLEGTLFPSLCVSLTLRRVDSVGPVESTCTCTRQGRAGGNWHTSDGADRNPRQQLSSCGCPLWGEAPTCSFSTWVSEITEHQGRGQGWLSERLGRLDQILSLTGCHR